METETKEKIICQLCGREGVHFCDDCIADAADRANDYEKFKLMSVHFNERSDEKLFREHEKLDW